MELDQWESRQVAVSQWLRPIGSHKIDSGPSLRPAWPPLEVVFGISLLYLDFSIWYFPRSCKVYFSEINSSPFSKQLGSCIWYFPLVFGLWGGVLGICYFPRSCKVYFPEIDSSSPSLSSSSSNQFGRKSKDFSMGGDGLEGFAYILHA